MKEMQLMNQQKEMEKEVYVAPSLQVIEVEMEGVLCSSGPVSAESDRWGGSWGDDF